MVVSVQKTLLIRCEICGRIETYDINLFNIPKGEKIEYKSSFNSTGVFIKTLDYKTYFIESHCPICGSKHIYRYSLKHMLKYDNWSNIHEYKNCFIENKGYDEETVLKDEDEFNNYLKKFKILLSSLERLEKLNEEGKIICDCGNDKMRVELFPDRIELICENCKSVQIIYTETEEDLAVLLKKEEIHLKAHNISYIDSIAERIKDVKRSNGKEQ